MVSSRLRSPGADCRDGTVSGSSYAINRWTSADSLEYVKSAS
jgi:hypothetical protein